MLRPKDLNSSDYVVALKPTLGYEKQLFVSTGDTYELGTFEVIAPNSGVYTPNAADNAALATDAHEVAAVLNVDASLGASNLILTLTGTDQNGQALTNVATFSVPAYSSFTERVFPKSFAVEAIPNQGDGKLVKTVTSIAVQCAADAIGTKIKLFAIPPVSTFRRIGCKTQLNYNLKVPMPYAVQCGRDKAAFVKPGEIEEGKLDITAKIPTESDGLARINGIRVTGLVKDVKEDKLDVQHTFLIGLIMTSKVSSGESVDPATLAADALYEDIAVILAQ
jgi:hypothetical protein